MLSILKYPLELLLFVALTYVLFKLFCHFANSSRFGQSLKAAKGTADTDDELIAARDATKNAALNRAAAIDGEVATKQAASERLRNA